MNLAEASPIAHNFARKHGTPLKVYATDETLFVFMPVPINSGIVFRASSAGFHKADASEDGSLVIIYHKQVYDPKDKELKNPLVEQNTWKDICKFVAHWAELKKGLGEPKENPYPKGIAHIESNSSRRILIGQMPTHKYLYDSKKDLIEDLKYEDLENAI